MKKCYKCAVVKELFEFSKHKQKNDGLQTDCKSCVSDYKKARYLANPEKAKEKNKAWYLANQEKAKEKSKAWRLTNPEKAKEKDKAKYLANPEKAKEISKAWQRANPDKRKRYQKKYQLANPDKINANTAKRTASKLNATPPWAELDLIKIVYSKAKELGSQVDHIVPLKSALVCGLHVWSNLQVLPPEINKAKSNIHWPDMP